MAMDGIMLSAVISELQAILPQGRVDKVTQPEKDMVILQVRTLKGMVAVRVVVKNLRDCYGALGVVHSLWRPCPIASRTISIPPNTASINPCTRR